MSAYLAGAACQNNERLASTFMAANKLIVYQPQCKDIAVTLCFSAEALRELVHSGSYCGGQNCLYCTTCLGFRLSQANMQYLHCQDCH